MSQPLDENYTEGPEGYFVNSTAAPQAHAGQRRPARRDRRRQRSGRREEDAQLRRAQRRLLWINATLGAVLTAAAVMAVAERLD